MKMTIAELRAREVERLTEITKDADEARHLMNRFYRLCGALDRLLHLENDEKTAKRTRTAEIRARTDKAVKALENDFAGYGLLLVFYGHLPTITDRKGGSDVIYRYFYN